MSPTQIDQSKLKSEAPEDGSRRYKEGNFPAYDTEYHRLASRSVILNDSAKAGFGNAFPKTDIGNCKRSLIELVGGENGYYKREGSKRTALIPAAKSNLAEVYKDFKRWQARQVKGGHALEPPETWPEGLLTERLKAEARLDVRRAEKYLLENRIEKLKKEQGKAEPEEPILPIGPVGHNLNIPSPKPEEKEWLIDGQIVSVSSRGIPFIACEDSPYHLMPVAVYRKMVKQWRKAIGVDVQAFDLMKLRKRRDKLFEKAKKEAAKKGEQPPVKREGVTNGKLDVWFRRLDITEDDWPEWPEDAKSIDELEDA